MTHDSTASATEPRRDAQQVAWILGMHRSGTSLTSKVIQCLGYSLGPSEKMMPPEPGNNDEGFWEHTELTGLNDEILRTLGGAWHTIPSEPICHDDARLADIRARAQAIFEADFADADRWAWKDPRTSVTAPFWQPFAPQAEYVICMRGPQAVASSLAARDHFSYSMSVDLWFDYTCAAIENTDGKKRLFLFYDDWMEDPEQQVDLLARFLGLSLTSDEYATNRQAALDAIRLDLRHHQTDLLASIEDDELPVHVKALYLNLRLLSQGTDAAIPPDIDRAITVVAKELAEAGAVIREHAPALEALESLRSVHELTQSHVDNLTDLLEAERQRSGDLERRRYDLECELGLASVHVRNITAMLEATQAEVSEVGAERDLANVQIQGLQANLDAASTMAAEQQRQHEALVAEREQQATQLHQSEQHATQLQLEVEWLRSGRLSRGMIYVRTLGMRAAVLRLMQPWRWRR